MSKEIEVRVSKESIDNLIVKVSDMAKNNQIEDLIGEFEKIVKLLKSDKNKINNLKKIDLSGLNTIFEYLLHNFRKSKLWKGVIKNLLFEILDIYRENEILKRLYDTKLGTKWLENIIETIKVTDFTTGQLFRQRLKTYEDKPLFGIINKGSLEYYSWKWIDSYTKNIAKRIISLNPGRKIVCLMTENRIEGACFDLACLFYGIKNALIPPNSMPDQIEYMLNLTKSDILVVSNEKQYLKLLEIQNKINIKHIITFEKIEQNTISSTMSLEEFLKSENKITEELLEERFLNVKSEDIATIMFTSGTTGDPKGVLFTQLNIVSKRFARAGALPDIGSNDRFICFLPLFHTFGRYLEMIGSIYWGAEYIFMENPALETLLDNMKRSKPSIFISVPKKWIQIYERIHQNLSGTETKQQIKKAVEKMTGGNLKWGLSAAGFLSPDIFKFFQNNGIELLSGYGMTEATGGITMTPPSEYVEDSTGKALPAIEADIIEDGELRIAGPYVSPGYFTENGIEFRKDKWYYTGDIFSKDKNGYFRILDRKKDIYKNSKGQTIAPQRIEHIFEDFIEIKRAFVVGDGRDYNTLLLIPDREQDEIVLPSGKKELKEFFKSIVNMGNMFLAPFERVVDFLILDRDFSAVDGEITPKGSLNRKKIEENYHSIIEEMYKKNYISIIVSNIEIRIPIWFTLRRGVIEDDIYFKDGTIYLKDYQLKVNLINKKPHLIQIGDLCYEIKNKLVELDEFLRIPYLWVGNSQLVEFAGQDINDWSIPKENISVKINLEKDGFNKVPGAIDYGKFIKLRKSLSYSGLHYAIRVMFDKNLKKALDGIEYISEMIEKGLYPEIKLARDRLSWAAYHTEFEIRKKAYLTLLFDEMEKGYESVFPLFIAAGREFLDEITIFEICKREIDFNRLTSLRTRLKNYRTLEKWPAKEPGLSQFVYILRLYEQYGKQHYDYYKAVREELVSWILFDKEPYLSRLAYQLLFSLANSFHDTFKNKKTKAIDEKTSQEYTWEDTVIIEEGIDEHDKKWILKCIYETSFILEAVFLIHDGLRIDLDDIPVNGIWVSQLDTKFGIAKFRISVSTKKYGHYDILAFLSESRAKEGLMENIIWQIKSNADPTKRKIISELGSFWENYGIYTTEFVSGETVWNFVTNIDFIRDKSTANYSKKLLPYVICSALSAYIDFWDRCDRKWLPGNHSPQNIVFPVKEYFENSKIISLNHRIRVESIAEIILKFNKCFFQRIKFHYPDLEQFLDRNMIFASFIEVLGEQQGIEILSKALQELELMNTAESVSLKNELANFIKTVKTKGYIPKAFYLSINRYKRWEAINPRASANAKINNLRELFELYNIDKLEDKYPGLRYRMFKNTVFARSSKKLLKRLEEIITLKRKKGDYEDKISNLIYQMQNDIKLSENEKLYITSMTFPYVEPSVHAELIPTIFRGTHKAELQVYYIDNHGKEFHTRPPLNPKEIDKFNYILYQAHLEVKYTSEHSVIVAVDENDFMLGGIIYKHIDHDTVYLDKIVVAPPYRNREIGTKMIKDFTNRMSGKGYSAISVQFLQRKYFENMGFKYHQKYGGLVYFLKNKHEV